MVRSSRRLLLLLLLILIVPFGLAVALPALAQDAQPTPATTEEDSPIPQVHQVTEGENLTVIATAYGITVADLLRANNLTDADVLQIGQQLVIPGGTGEIVSAVYAARLGDTIAGIAADFNTAADEIVSANRLIVTSPPLLAGQPVAVISRTGTDAPRPRTGRPYLVAAGETLLSIAVQHRLTPAELAAANDLALAATVFPGQRLRIPDDSVAYRDLPEGWVDIQMRPQQAAQGSTISIYVQHLGEGEPVGRLGEQPLLFSPFGRGYVALVGIDAFAEPGVYELVIGGDEAHPWQPLVASLPLVATNYDTQFITVDEALDGLLDPELRADEDAFLKTIYANFNEPQRWEGIFQIPISETIVSAGYGGRRSYNGGPIEIYHTGVDWAAGEGATVVAPAAGVVVFSDDLELRGGTIIIDHGLGVMTGYYHLSERLVEAGNEVVAGQDIGAVGSTGLSSGPHLHWDLRIMDVPVDGNQWLAQSFP